MEQKSKERARKEQGKSRGRVGGQEESKKRAGKEQGKSGGQESRKMAGKRVRKE